MRYYKKDPKPIKVKGNTIVTARLFGRRPPRVLLDELGREFCISDEVVMELIHKFSFKAYKKVSRYHLTKPVLLPPDKAVVDYALHEKVMRYVDDYHQARRDYLDENSSEDPGNLFIAYMAERDLFEKERPKREKKELKLEQDINADYEKGEE